LLIFHYFISLDGVRARGATAKTNKEEENRCGSWRLQAGAIKATELVCLSSTRPCAFVVAFSARGNTRKLVFQLMQIVEFG
jgi:hypothetical protein